MPVALPQILGVDLLRTKDVRSTHKLVADHIARVRTIKGLEQATAVLQLESNLAFECQVHATRYSRRSFHTRQP